jgi:excinuclease ABC subunit B
MPEFKVHSPFVPAGDQPKAIEKLTTGLKRGDALQTLLGVTGSGKTFTMAHVIANYGRPTLVMAHNKTLAFQLYKELKELFPENRVEFFISYYDYYQPESYIPASDTYIEKDAKVNPKIDMMRLSATVNLMSRKDTIVVASVSAIYGLGDPEPYKKLVAKLKTGQKYSRRELMQRLLKLQYERNDTVLEPGNFRVKGNIVDVMPSYSSDVIIRIQLQGNTIGSITELSFPDIEINGTFDEYVIFPAKHFVVEDDKMERAIHEIKAELDERLPILEQENKLYAYRLNQKVNYDLEMIQEMGYCNGIENYSRFFDGRKEGERPFTLIDFFPDDFLLIMDESHQSIPQINGMYKGDRSRKETLVDYGFRLPSALDNRPMKFPEFEKFMKHTVCVSATPAQYELERSSQVVEQIIRPTGLIDPIIEIHPSAGQMQHLIGQIRETTKAGNRVLVTTITKRLAEEITEYFSKHDIKVRYLHSEIDTLERTEIIRQLRLKEFDVLVGINLLREGLDIPEVGLMAILDADKEGFLRNDKSLIQIIGRAARNKDARVIMYADRETDAMKKTIAETSRRRRIQLAYNKKYNITPQTVKKTVPEQVIILKEEKTLPKNDIPKRITQLEKEMKEAANNLDFELAIQIRNQIKRFKQKLQE